MAIDTPEAAPAQTPAAPATPVVQQGNTTTAFANIHPLLRAHFEARLIPGSVVMRIALGVAVLNFVCRARRVNGNGKCDLEHLVFLVPIDFGVKADSWSWTKGNPLHDL